MINHSTEYALRALVYLASNRTRGPILAKEIAEQAEVPRTYLSKLLYEMKKAGFLEATRGKTGGYRIAVNPGKLTLAEIVTHFEGRGINEKCFLKHAKCSERAPCSVHTRWRPISDMIMRFIEGTTIEEISGALKSDSAPMRAGERVRNSKKRSKA